MAKKTVDRCIKSKSGSKGEMVVNICSMLDGGKSMKQQTEVSSSGGKHKKDKIAYNNLAGKEAIARTIAALKANGINAVLAKDREEARNKALSMIPKGSEVMTMSSVTLDITGIAKAINESGDYESVKTKLYSMDRATEGADMRKLGAAPEYAIGSVHAVTEDGKIVVASNTGSQLPAYAYSAGNVIWVVGAQKLVKDLDQAMDRIYNYTLPLENARARKAYGVDSFISKILILNREITAGRATMLIVEEELGF